MSDSKRAEFQNRGAAADRDGRTEALLVEGLDQYFRANYEEAIHLWTRVLFLDRTHARARAYIARARTAISERQRRSEEMLHTIGELLGAGELERARRMLSHVEQTAGADEKVAELWARIERVARTRPNGLAAGMAAAVVDVVPVRTWRPRARSTVAFVAAAAAGLLLITAAASPALGDWFSGEARAPGGVTLRMDPLPTLSSSDAALVRARTLYAGGRLAEALAALDRSDANGPDREAIDALRIELQQWLLTPRRGVTSEPTRTNEGAP